MLLQKLQLIRLFVIYFCFFWPFHPFYYILLTFLFSRSLCPFPNCYFDCNQSSIDFSDFHLFFYLTSNTISICVLQLKGNKLFCTILKANYSTTFQQEQIPNKGRDKCEQRLQIYFCSLLFL